MKNHKGIQTHELAVQRTDLMKALSAIRRHSRRAHNTDIVLSFRKTALSITLDTLTLHMPANGSWPARVRIPGSFLHTVALFPPEDDPVNILIRDGFIQIGSTSMKYLK